MATQQQALALPTHVVSRVVPNVNGLDMHILEAKAASGNDQPLPLLLLLHGFPELAYSYRKVIEPLSMFRSGYHVVAPDQRGYGRTTGWDKDNLDSFRMLNLVTDIIALVSALGYHTVECVIGHDSGSRVAAYCALIRPDIFRSVVMMSAPFPGAPSLPPRDEAEKANALSLSALADGLLALDPPRKHYVQYLSPPSLSANHDMLHVPQGLPTFLRAFYHMKSADWAPNDPHSLQSWSADELAKLPEYYVMRADKTMPESVLPHLSSAPSPCEWLTDAELAIYANEFARTSFQGGMNWYHFTMFSESELRVFAGKCIEVPALFVSGEKDWGTYQVPGYLDKMKAVCEKMDPDEGCILVKGAGHWVQQEQPNDVVRIITHFLGRNQSQRV